MDGDEKDIGTMSAEDCQTEIDTTLENAEHVYWGKPGSSPSHTKAVERINLLHKKVLGARAGEPHDGLEEKLRKEGVEAEEDLEKLAAEKAKEDEEEEVPLTESQAEGFKKLESEWGERYEANLAEAQGAYQGIVKLYCEDNPGFKDLMESGLGNEPSVIKLFAELGRQSREDLKAGWTCPHCGESVNPDEEE